MSSPVRWIRASLLGAVAAGCTSMSAISSPYATYIANKQPTTVWVTRGSHAPVKVDGPRVFKDTLVGSVSGEYTEIALSDVTRMTAIHSDKTKTILAATAGGVATMGALVWIFQGQGSSTPNTPTGPGGVPCDPDTGCGPGQ